MKSPADPMRTHFVLLTNFEAFVRETNKITGAITFTSPALAETTPWTELVLSWGVVAESNALVRFEARPLPVSASLPSAGARGKMERAIASPLPQGGEGGEGVQGRSDFYCLGVWSPSQPPRTSVNGQKDSRAEVKTDILALRDSAHGFQLRFVSQPDPATRSAPVMRYLGVSLVNTRQSIPELPSSQHAWGRTLDVPRLSQLAYPNGRGWCSPTCVSMVLAWWARQLNRPELARDVPEVAAAIFDPAWPGTGNWSFNVAYAGSLGGLQGLTLRLEDITQLEDWIGQGVPVVCSVSYPILKGKPGGDGGHLIVCVGFTVTGDLIVNDPWARLESGESVRKIFPRDRFLAAWRHSQQTVYLIHPPTLSPSWERRPE